MEILNHINTVMSGRVYFQTQAFVDPNNSYLYHEYFTKYEFLTTSVLSPYIIRVVFEPGQETGIYGIRVANLKTLMSHYLNEMRRIQGLSPDIRIIKELVFQVVQLQILIYGDLEHEESCIIKELEAIYEGNEQVLDHLDDYQKPEVIKLLLESVGYLQEAAADYITSMKTKSKVISRRWENTAAHEMTIVTESTNKLIDILNSQQ